MANDGSVIVPPDSTGKRIDCASLSAAGATVYRQRVVIADGTRSANFAVCSAGSLQTTIQNSINVSAMPAVNISAMPAVVLAAGTGTVGAVTVAGFIDPSGNQRNVVDSANTALRVNVVAGGSGGGIVTGPNAQGVSGSAALAPVINGGIDSAGGGVIRAFLTTNTGIQIVTGQVSVTGSVAVSNIVGGLISLTGTASVVIAAGTANIGTINNISAAVVLAAGSNNIGTINNISAAVTLANGATVNISTMPAVVLAAGAANIGTIQAISATVNVNLAAQSAGFIVAAQGPVAFNASVTAGNAPMLMGGRVKTSASTTATAHAAVFLWMDKAGRAIVQSNAASLHPSATHGPKSVTLSASANTVLVASAGTACIFVDSIMVTSNLAAVTRCDIYETPSSAAPEVSAYLAIGGGGFTNRYDPPWQLSAGQALSARLKPSASAQVIVMVHFHVGPN